MLHFNKQVQPLMTGHWCRAMATMMLSGMSGFVAQIKIELGFPLTSY